MSFSPSNTTKTAENNLSGSTSALQNQQYPMLTAAGTNLFSQGGTDVTSGTNFLNTMLQGNQANTTAMLQPSIDQIRGGSANTLNAINTLTPRGGGRSSALFGQSFQPQQQIQNLFNQGRTTAATALPQIGLQQQQLGTNLFGMGTNALVGAGGMSNSLAQLSQSDRATSLAIASALGKSLFNVATTPFGGGSSSNGLLGLIGGG